MKKSLTSSAIPILGVLARRPMSGYEIKAFIEQSIGNFWHESYGQLYPQLKLLVACGAIKDATPPEQKDKPQAPRAKKTYRITAKGREILHEWIAQKPATRPLREELLLKVFFASSSDIHILHEHCKGARRQAVEHEKKYLNVVEELENMPPELMDKVFWKMTADFGVRKARMLIEWYDEVIPQLEAFAPEIMRKSSLVETGIEGG